jgi:TonB-like protein
MRSRFRSIALAVTCLTRPCPLLGQTITRPDSAQVAQARALCGPLADDSVKQNALWLPPPDAVFSGQVLGVGLPSMLPSSSAAPEYPGHLRRQGIEGRVIAAAIVATTGRVEPGSVKVSVTPHPDFIPAVERYLERARYSPGHFNGRPVRVCIITPLDFRTVGR